MANDGVFNDQRLLGRKTIELMRSDHLPVVLADDDLDSIWAFGLGCRVIKDPISLQAPGLKGVYFWGGAAGTIF